MVEYLTEDNWHWWSQRPKMRMLRYDETRAHWICVSGHLMLKYLKLRALKNCGSHQWVEMPKAHAENYKELLAQSLRTSPNERNDCPRKQRRPFRETPAAWITQITGSKAWASTSIGDQDIALQPTLSTAAQTTSPPPKSIQNASNNSQAGRGARTVGAGLSISMGIANDLYIFFCVKGARRTLEMAQIDVDKQVDDRAFFDKIRTEYRRKRGFLRYWFSPSQLKDCELIKVCLLSASYFTV